MRETIKRSPSVRLPSRAASQRIAILVLITVGVALLMIGRTDPETFDSARERAMIAARPVLEIASKPVDKFRQWRANIGDMIDVYEENKRLRAENAELKAAQDKARALQSQLERYQALLNVRLDPGTEFVTARVVGDSGGPFMRSLIVTAGAKDGIEEGHGVVDARGLVGRIIDVGPEAARVLLLTDVSSRIPVIVVPGNYRSILAGDNSGDPTLEFLPPGAVIKAGDAIITSGHGGLLPPGLPVGRVSSRYKGGEAVRVTLDSDIARADIVRILKFRIPAEVPAAPTDVLPPAPIPQTGKTKEPAAAAPVAETGVAPGAAGHPAGAAPLAAVATRAPKAQVSGTTGAMLDGVGGPALAAEPEPLE